MRAMVALLCLFVAGCSNGTGGGDTDASPSMDGSVTSRPDSTVVSRPDSTVTRPDSTVPLPDGSAPDVSVPDGSLPDADPPDAMPPGGSFTCTQVIGYSQVGESRGGWFTTGGAFESVVDDDRWQLLWNGGAGVDQWQNSGYVGWTRSVISPCATASGAPDRVLLSVSGPYGDDEMAWATAIQATIAQIRAKLPSVRQIVLQPVVGGPMHQGCMQGCGLVRASWQHAHIDAAIARVVGGDVVAGFSPEVRTCADYRDGLGHLTSAGAEAAGRTIGMNYRP
ncbi:MAG: hypothetical protein AAGF12_14460 [Myxococcota bacterium]